MPEQPVSNWNLAAYLIYRGFRPLSFDQGTKSYDFGYQEGLEDAKIDYATSEYKACNDIWKTVVAPTVNATYYKHKR